MAWTTPMTAVANTAFTASDFNTYVRDNLLATGTGTATSSVGNGSILTKSATNTVTWRTPKTATVATSQSTSSSSYGNLSTNGPALTTDTGAWALVIIGCSLKNNSTNSSFMGVSITGASSISADDSRALRHRDGTGSDGEECMSYAKLYQNLTPGTNTFTAKYRVIGGTGTFSNRELVVIPL